MAKLLALEWDGREARIAVATPRGAEVQLEDAFAIDIPAVASEDVGGDPREIGRRIAEALAARGLTGCDALVGLGRSSIELRSLSLPLAPPEELPDLVRFQALQAFTSIGEDWPLDFVELGEQDGALNVLAAVLAPKQVEHILQVCAASQLKARCLVLRPFAAASLLKRSRLPVTGHGALIVDLLADGADLTATLDGLVVFMRTVRLPAAVGTTVQAAALLGEVRRTIAAAQAQMSGVRIEQIVICGSETEHPILAQSLRDALRLDVVVFDPFRVVRVAAHLAQQPVADAGRYAPLLGMLADEMAGTRHAIDFLNPRKRPAPRSHRRRNVLIGAAVLTLLGVIGGTCWARIHTLDGQIRTLRDQIAALDKDVEQARTLVAKADAVREFTEADVTWLDELYVLAQRMPDADKVKLDEVRLGASLKRGGVMTLKGHVTSSDIIAAFEESLRRDDNVVAGRYGTIDRNQRDYPYLLDTTVSVPPDEYDNGRSRGRPFRKTLQPPSPVDAVTRDAPVPAAAAPTPDAPVPAAAAPTPDAPVPAAEVPSPGPAEPAASPTDPAAEDAPPISPGSPAP
ncbi:MAG: hypothetical protein MUF48_00720 [Pirellulaceae bacterium]|jgi:Tfp pilus assembly PilM family ATPase/outer membrane murein-binding lipoprotein Lpp|nr:hypothetical protein [Pirellulaceae bacterium]